MCDRLAKQGIGVNFKLDRRNGNIVGVSFTKDGVSFNGSRIDRSMGFYRLDKLLGGRIAEGLGWRNNLYHTRPTAESGISQTETIYKPDKSFELTDKAYSTDGHAVSTHLSSCASNLTKPRFHPVEAVEETIATGARTTRKRTSINPKR